MLTYAESQIREAQQISTTLPHWFFAWGQLALSGSEQSLINRLKQWVKVRNFECEAELSLQNAGWYAMGQEKRSCLTLGSQVSHLWQNACKERDCWMCWFATMNFPISWSSVGREGNQKGKMAGILWQQEKTPLHHDFRTTGAADKLVPNQQEAQTMFICCRMAFSPHLPEVLPDTPL